MKNFSYTALRRIIFSIYVLFAIIFCLLLFNLGYKEIKKARLYAERERSYFDSLLKCRESLNKVQEVLNNFLAERKKKFSIHLKKEIVTFRKNVNTLIRSENKRMLPGILGLQICVESVLYSYPQPIH